MYRNAPSPSPLLVTAADGIVVAHDRSSGQRVWRFEVEGRKENLAKVTRCLVEQERVLALACRMRATGFMGSADSFAVLVCLDYASGRLVWRQEVGVGLNVGFYTSTMLVDSGQVFVSHGAALVAFSLETGAVLWKQPVEGAGEGPRTIGVTLALQGVAVQGDAR